MRKAIFSLQAGLVLIGVGVTFFLAGQAGGVAAAYGGLVALANTWMLGRRVQRADHAVADNAQYGMITLYISAVARFVFILVALAVGMGVLKLAPLPLVATFVGAQAAFMVASLRMSSR
jgi:ATP synthase protein I